MTVNPNFPANLDISPCLVERDGSSRSSADFGVASQAEAIKLYGIAGRVWEAAYALTAYIEGPAFLQFDPPFLENDPTSLPPSILELGSGTGIVASCLAERLAGTPCRVVATDLPEVCPLLEKNLGRYITVPGSVSAPSVLVRPLTWGNERHAVDLLKELENQTPPLHDRLQYGLLTHVVCSDLVYFPELLAPLLRTLLQVTSPPFTPPRGTNKYPRLVISYKIRSLPKETPFWSALGLWFTFEPVLVKGLSNTAQDSQAAADEAWSRFGSSENNDTFIFNGRRRPESFGWTVPSNDHELLAGVGALGSHDRKGDSTFEELLLMQMEV